MSLETKFKVGDIVRKKKGCYGAGYEMRVTDIRPKGGLSGGIGVSHVKGSISWKDADSILDALEKAGIK